MSEKELSCVEFGLEVVFFLILQLLTLFYQQNSFESVDNNFR